MTDKAIIHAEFEDVKRIKTRKVWQLIFEVPEERYDAAIEALGGSPQSGQSRPVAIARLADEATEQAAQKPKGGPLSQEAGRLCKNPAFLTFLKMTYQEPSDPNRLPGLTLEGDCSAYVRNLCGVASRADIDHSEYARTAWKRIAQEFYDSQQGRTEPDLVYQRDRTR